MSYMVADENYAITVHTRFRTGASNVNDLFQQAIDFIRSIEILNE